MDWCLLLTSDSLLALYPSPHYAPHHAPILHSIALFTCELWLFPMYLRCWWCQMSAAALPQGATPHTFMAFAEGKALSASSNMRARISRIDVLCMRIAV